MKNLGGCAVLAAYGALVWAVLIAWSAWGATLPPGAQETVARAGILGVLGAGLVTVALACAAPVGRK